MYTYPICQKAVRGTIGRVFNTIPMASAYWGPDGFKEPWHCVSYCRVCSTVATPLLERSEHGMRSPTVEDARLQHSEGIEPVIGEKSEQGVPNL